MFEIVQFTNGRYGVMNTLTGIILTNRRGQAVQRRTVKGAIRFANKRNKHLSKFIARLSNR